MGREIERLIDALATARPGGATVREWSLYTSSSRAMSLGVKDNQAGNPHAPLSLSEGSGARYLLVWDDGRISRGLLERRQVLGDPREALEEARAAAYEDPDAAQVLGPREMPDVELHDRDTAAMADGDTGLLAERLAVVRDRLDTDDVRTWSGSFSAGRSAGRLQSSAGLDASVEQTTTGWFVNLNGEVGSGHSSRSPEPDADFVARIDRVLHLAQELDRPAEPMDGGTHPVILHPKVVEDYVLGTLLHHLDGSTVFHGEGRFTGAQFGSGETVLRDDLGLRLDPLRPLARGSYRFTTEGVPASRATFIEDGRLVQPVLDLKYAKRLGREVTPLPSTADSLQLEGPPELDLDSALAAADGGALVLSVLGVHTQDSASGDYSLSAPQVLRIGGARPAGRLRGTISGNLFDMLRHAELRRVRFVGEHTPGLLFPCRFDPQ